MNARPQKKSLLRHRPALCLALLGAVLFSGCIRMLQQPSLPRKEFALSLQSPDCPAHSLAPILAVRLFDAAPMFENQEFIYRLAETKWETDFYHLFTQPPSVLLTFETRRWMQRSGLFRSVAIPGLAPSQSWQLQGFVSELYGDFRNPAAPVAVLEMRFSLLPPGAQASTQPLFSRIYQQRTPVPAASPEGLVEAYNRAAELVLKRLTEDIRSAQVEYKRDPLPQPPPPTAPAAPGTPGGPGLLEALGL